MLKRFEIRHDIHHLTRRELKPRHRRMNSLKQRSLQVCNWISETQYVKWGSIRNGTLTNFADSVTLRAVLADKYQTSPLRWRLLCEGGFSYTQQNCAAGKKWPSELDGPSRYHVLSDFIEWNGFQPVGYTNCAPPSRWTVPFATAAACVILCCA
jgi:hypothetical protein